MHKFVTRLKEQAEENPSLIIGSFAAAGLASAKLIDAVSSARSRSAYAKQINHNVKRRR